MYKTLTLILLLCINVFLRLDAQVFPKENSILNYRLIGFSFPVIPQVENYKLQVAAGNYTSEDAFKKNIILSQYINTNKIIAEVPSFGQQYTWRVIDATNNKSLTKKNNLFHFSTGIIPAVDTGLNRLRIISPAKEYKDAYVFVDALGVLYDMKGNPIWYLPNILKLPGSIEIRDLKLSPLGTITFLLESRICEVDYNANILWKKPDIDSEIKKIDEINNLYHHEFTRLSNGHYMVLGSEILPCKLPSLKDSSFFIICDGKAPQDTTEHYEQHQFGTIVEFDENGNIVWLWRTAKYIMQSDLVNCRKPGGMLDPHDNSFFFDEQNKIVYLNFKNLSRIVKIKYPEGNVLNTYGKIYNKNSYVSFQLSGLIDNDYSLFCSQHACKLSPDGYLYVYNNGCDQSPAPKIVMMREPLTDNDSLEKIWEYNCVVDDTADHIDITDDDIQTRLNIGGNVIQLPDHSTFITMGTLSSKIFIVNFNKQILWSAVSETRNQNAKSWKMIHSYRASIIANRKDLEQLIWNSEKTAIQPNL